MTDTFDYINAILQNKKEVIVDEQTEKGYNAFVTNRTLSYHNDCVMFANEMNLRHFTDKKMQFDFLLNTIRAKRRPFNKWVKPEKNDDIEYIKRFFGYSNEKAKDALKILSQDQIKQIKMLLDTGGVSKK